MQPEEGKAFIRRFYEEVWDRRNYAAARELFADDGVRHELSGPVRGGAEGIARNAAAWCTTFPDTRCTVDHVIAEGDTVVACWTMTATHRGEWRGIPPTGRPIRFRGVNIYRIAGGKAAEIWSFRDDLGLFQQLGAIPPPGERHDAASRPDTPSTRSPGREPEPATDAVRPERDGAAEDTDRTVGRAAAGRGATPPAPPCRGGPT